METKKKVEYGDYVLMCCDKSDKECMPHEFIRNMSVTFMEYFEYMLQNGFDEIERHILTSLQLKKWCNFSDDEIIDSILPKTEMDRDKKLKKKDYYMANGKCAFDILKFIFTKELFDALKQSPSIVHHNYYNILRWILMDVDQLINEYNNNMNDDHQYSVTHRTIHAMSLHNVLRQSAYGRASFHSFSDVEIDASIAVIRQLVELRIRRAFAAIALVDQKGNLYPLDMISIFEILKKYEKDIVFPGRLSSIERIYKWSNLYIHSGRGDYAWITYFLEKYLRPLSFGDEKPDGSWNYNNAISLTKETYDKIEKELSELNDNFTVLKCKPECEIK